MSAFDQLLSGINVTGEVKHEIEVTPDTQRFIALLLVGWVAWGLVKGWAQ